jgi:hypothetical protein
VCLLLSYSYCVVNVIMSVTVAMSVTVKVTVSVTVFVTVIVTAVDTECCFVSGLRPDGAPGCT